MWERLTKRFGAGTQDTRDFIVFVVVTTVTAAVAVWLDLFERIWAWSRAHDDWQLDEIFTVLIVLSFGLIVLAWRRWMELRAEVARRAAVERELVRSRNLAETASNAKSEFLASISHEIRTPMNGIIGMTDLALETDLTELQRDYLQAARVSAETLLGLINNILDFSRIETDRLSIEPLRFGLRETLEECLRAVAMQAHRKGLELLLDVDDSVPEAAIGDAIRLNQIVSNLLSNAIKFTHRGEVILRARWEGQDRDQFLRLEVQDTGIGIPSEKQATIFAAFSQADVGISRRFGGAGLGLAIASRLVRLMRGRLLLESEPGAGSTFRLLLPFEPVPDADPAPVAPADPLAGQRVLVIDDNAPYRRILCQWLHRWGCRVQVAATGQEALQFLREAQAEGDPFRLALAELDMGDVDGLTLAHHMGELGITATCVIVINSLDRYVKGGELVRAGINSYLAKPVAPGQLRHTLVHALTGPGRPASPPPRRMLGRPLHGLHVLVAEDNPVNQKMVAAILQKLGCTLVAVRDGREAAEVFREGRFDLVLMDVEMPEVDGLEATRLIRSYERERSLPPVPVVGVTASALQGDPDACLGSGMNGYLAKPFHPEQLEAVIERVLCSPDEAAVMP